MNDADPPRSAAEALAIVERQQARTGSTLSPNVAAMITIWGLVYLLVGALYYLYRVGALGGVITLVAASVVGATASVVSAVYVTRSGRGVRGAPESERRWAYYGFGWPITLVLTGVLTFGASVTLRPQSPGVLTPVLFVFVVGLLFMSLGSMLPDGAQYATGAWIMVVAAAAIFTPSPAHILVLAIGAGGGMLVLGRIIARRVA